MQSEREAGNDLQAEDVLQDLLLSTDERVRLSAAIHLRKTGPATPTDPDDDLITEFV